MAINDSSMHYNVPLPPVLYEMLKDNERRTGETIGTQVARLIEQYYSDDESEYFFPEMVA